MRCTLDEVLREALELSEEDRAHLAAVLIESLEDKPDPGVEAAWDEEISRRIDDIEAGTLKTVPWEEVRQKLRDQLKERWASLDEAGRD